LIDAVKLVQQGKINPSTIPGLKPGVCSGLILSGAFNPVLKAGVWRRRSIKPIVSKTFPLEEAETAHQMILANKITGRAALII
jgi:hypothetical protein